MGTTTKHALPYPEPTDAVAAGADAIKALAQALAVKLPTAYYNDYNTGPLNTNGQAISYPNTFRAATVTGFTLITIVGQIGFGGAHPDFSIGHYVPDQPILGGTGILYQSQINTGAVGAGQWKPMNAQTLWSPITVGVLPRVQTTVFVGSPGQTWYYSVRVNVVEFEA